MSHPPLLALAGEQPADRGISRAELLQVLAVQSHQRRQNWHDPCLTVTPIQAAWAAAEPAENRPLPSGRSPTLSASLSCAVPAQAGWTAGEQARHLLKRVEDHRSPSPVSLGRGRRRSLPAALAPYEVQAGRKSATPAQYARSRRPCPGLATAATALERLALIQRPPADTEASANTQVSYDSLNGRRQVSSGTGRGSRHGAWIPGPPETHASHRQETLQTAGKQPF